MIAYLNGLNDLKRSDNTLFFSFPCLPLKHLGKKAPLWVAPL